MQWCEAIVHTTTAGSDIVSELMMRFGATGTEIVDRSDVPDPTKPGVYWELYDAKMLDAMPEDVLVKGWFAQNELTHGCRSDWTQAHTRGWAVAQPGKATAPDRLNASPPAER